jgi:hypothetical protein
MRSAALLVLLATSCGGGWPKPGTSGDRDDEPGLTALSFLPSDEEIPNPERGFHDDIDLVRGGDFSWVRAEGLTLAFANIRLDAYRSAPLDARLLDALTSGFADVRAAGIKVVLRFVYNDGDQDPDAPRARILEHLRQLQPILAANADVIAVMQAGFIGAWGEWHTSSNGLDNPADRAAILAAIVDALPASRMTQVRTPMFKAASFGGPLTAGFDGSPAARIGHHDDCFLVSDDDLGTYAEPIQTWKDYVAEEGRFTPVGGVSCAINPPRTDCPTALREMDRHHWSFVSALYHHAVLEGWTAQGCMPEMRKRLGYRIALVEVAHSERVAPGGILRLSITLANVGWAAMFNPRSVVVVLGNEQAALDVDPRTWEPGSMNTLNVRLRVPADLAPGNYRLALRLPDPLLPDNPLYAVELANWGVWDAPDNVLTERLIVDDAATGDVDGTAAALVQLPD